MALYDFLQNAMNICQTTWIVSDLHFGEQDLKNAYPNRPSDKELVKLINKSVGKNDFLIILGDIGDLTYVPKLRGKLKYLIMGNHDAGASNYKRQIWYNRFNMSEYQKDEALLETKRLHPNCTYRIDTCYSVVDNRYDKWEVRSDNNLFDVVFEGPLMVSEKLILSHEPINVPWAYNIHGHCHEPRVNETGTNVCIDANGYQLLNFNRFLKSGALSGIETLHRSTIDTATERKANRKE